MLCSADYSTSALLRCNSPLQQPDSADCYNLR
jgi:hypothetical protein